MRPYSVAATLLALLFGTTSGFAEPNADSARFGRFNVAPEEVAPDLEAYDFNGIIALSNCSGSLVRFDDSVGSDPGMILTNGHCVRMLSPGEVVYRTDSSRAFDVLDSNARKIGEVRATKLLYATMTKTDMALYQLRETYDQIQTSFQTEPLTLARANPADGTPVEVLSGYWKRAYACAVDATVYSLKEGNWLFQDSVRYSRPGCDMVGGTSGSPVTATGTRTVVAVNNTGNESGRKCTVNNPCEIDEDGTVRYEKGLGYAQQTYWVYGCRNDQGQLDVGVAGCALPRPDSVQQDTLD